MQADGIDRGAPIRNMSARIIKLIDQKKGDLKSPECKRNMAFQNEEKILKIIEINEAKAKALGAKVPVQNSANIPPKRKRHHQQNKEKTSKQNRREQMKQQPDIVASTFGKDFLELDFSDDDEESAPKPEVHKNKNPTTESRKRVQERVQEREEEIDDDLALALKMSKVEYEKEKRRDQGAPKPLITDEFMGFQLPTPVVQPSKNLIREEVKFDFSDFNDFNSYSSPPQQQQQQSGFSFDDFTSLSNPPASLPLPTQTASSIMQNKEDISTLLFSGGQPALPTPLSGGECPSDFLTLDLSGEGVREGPEEFDLLS